MGRCERVLRSWVAKFKGDQNSECKLSNGRSQSNKVIKLLFSAGNEWSRSYREITQHPSRPWNFITHGFLDPSAFPEIRLCGSRVKLLLPLTGEGQQKPVREWGGAILHNELSLRIGASRRTRAT